jgi:molybdopterin/thiamine biosynthesis adenylyltransferase/rhodanese-related sulfurtransferase
MAPRAAPKHMSLAPERYMRQLALPDITLADQQRLGETHIAIIGAGGLGCAALPYLAAAGVGHISIYDHDDVSRSNLHRQTLYKDDQIGQNKAGLAAQYASDLNPEIQIDAYPKRFSDEDLNRVRFDILFDGSDNFKTKTLLNTLSIKHEIPLISASVNQWHGQIGYFAGFAKDYPCYHCLFPELPDDARNCNEAGILGTSAGLTGMYQAHLVLLALLGKPNAQPSTVLTFDFANLRMQTLHLKKDKTCPHCKDANTQWAPEKEQHMVEMISMAELAKKDHIIVDVRRDEELEADPINGPTGPILHMEVSTIPQRCTELPKDKLLAFVCAGNVRSFQAAEYLQAIGYDNVIVLDKFSI